MEYKLLNNGVKMPMLGFGVYQTPPEDTERCVAEALGAGYRLIDTAQAYGNEEGVGAAIAKSGVPRDEVFVTSKIWVSNMNYERAAASIDESLRKLGTDYIDLMLLHQAMGDYPGAYRAMEDAYRAGKLRAIGVSNFYPERLVDVCALAEVPPAVNQVETHPFRQQRAAHETMLALGVAHEAWAPFAEGQNDIFQNESLHHAASKLESRNGRRSTSLRTTSARSPRRFWTAATIRGDRSTQARRASGASSNTCSANAPVPQPRSSRRGAAMSTIAKGCVAYKG